MDSAPGIQQGEEVATKAVVCRSHVSPDRSWCVENEAENYKDRWAVLSS